MDSEIVPLEIAGIAAGNASRGHRVLHGHSVLLPSVKSYVDTLRAASVVVDVAERRQIIRKALDAATRTVPARAGARTKRWWKQSHTSPSGPA